MPVFDCEVVSQNPVLDGVFEIMLNCPEIAHEAKAGQFVMVRVIDGADPMLRRPFSIHGVHRGIGVFSLIYAICGKGTELLAKKQSGDKVSVVGPLGKPFNLGEDPSARHILVCGGCGAAPMFFLCETLCKKWGSDKVMVLLGAKSNNAMLRHTEFLGYGAKVGIATEDGTLGYQGFVSKLLESHFSIQEQLSVEEQLTWPAHGTRVYSCGPEAMLKEVARISSDAEVASCQVSLEHHMACGIGVCNGCVVRIKDDSSRGWHNERVCKDGPVFEAGGVIWE